MKKHTNNRLKVKLETVRQLAESDHRSVVGGSSVVFTCTSTRARPDEPTEHCFA
jgi:hypothetical protein